MVVSALTTASLATLPSPAPAWPASLDDDVRSVSRDMTPPFSDFHPGLVLASNPLLSHPLLWLNSFLGLSSDSITFLEYFAS